VIWAGTDDGLIHVTFNGGRSWKDVTPEVLRDRPWSKISLIDASHTDTLTAYAAVNTLRLDDLRPHIYRTRDGGKSWTEIVRGIDSGATINAVREDPKRKGLLFAGSETQVWVSFDDGDNWRSLRLNMPAISIRDLVIKDDDIAVGTHGRSFWILDDITPLRQLTDSTADRDLVLFRPQTAIRWRWNLNTDTPIPPEEPAGQNPPDGAIINYWLRSATDAAKLEVLDSTGRVIRTYSSADTAMPPADIGNVPKYWIRPTQVLSRDAGMHRFVWDMRYERPAVLSGGYPISAIVGNTPREPRGVWVIPGTYTIRLTAGGRTMSQPLVVRMDPRVKTSRAGLARQLTVSLRLDEGIRKSSTALRELRALRGDLTERRGRTTGGAVPDSSTRVGIDSAMVRLAVIEGTAPGPRTESLVRVHGELVQLLDLAQDADLPPTTQLEAAIADRLRILDLLLARWQRERQVSP
jgi:hypothetical protein